MAGPLAPNPAPNKLCSPASPAGILAIFIFIFVQALASELSIQAAWAYPNDQAPNQAFQKAVKKLNIQLIDDVNQEPEKPIKITPLQISPIIPTILCLILLFIVLRPIFRALYGELKKSKAGQKLDSSPLFTDSASKQNLDTIQASADALAEKGLFTEAIHKLLLDTIDQIKLNKNLTVTPSLTSREIILLLNLEAKAEQAFHTLVEKVELTWFGGRPPASDDYTKCRAVFVDLKKTLNMASPKARGAA
ncbi:MAG: hypothetical protein LBE31_04215 [Deltaproteobacteria bacterium]|jgi:hypothetical protein|nr:hypothetical protein [Deltaproteobacteria bacterium]